MAQTRTDTNIGPVVPATDSTNNISSRDVLGSKADTPAGVGTAANSTLSLMGMLKALWNLLRVVTFPAAPASLLSVQYGSITIAISSTSNTATITTVGTKAVLHHLGSRCADSNPARGLIEITKTNNTTITATRDDGSVTAATVRFCIEDWA